MCGISGCLGAGISVLPVEAKAVLRNAIKYRGRSNQGEWQDGDVHLFHSRLPIIDLETGSQPMQSTCGRYVVVFNGEIYNYRELRNEYERAGARFHTDSDTEVILEGFRLKGDKVCEDLNGMFAFALWDRIGRRLFMARDRLGKKPLFWTQLVGVFYFSSTLDAFSALPGWSGAFNSGAIYYYGLVGGFPEDASVFSQARALPPASRAWVTPGQKELRSERYWRPKFESKSRASFAELLADYETLLSDATRIRLRSDVPVAITFSGGVDSGTLAAIAKKNLAVDLDCYTVDYHTTEDPSEETRIAQAVAEHLGLEWRYIHFDYHNDLLHELSSAYSCYDQPCQQMALVYSRRLYAAIKSRATVILSGNGADELFTGYDGDERNYLQGLVLSSLRWTRPLLKNTSITPYLRMPLPDAHAEALINKAKGAGASSEVIDCVAHTARELATEAHLCGVRSALDLKMLFSLRYSSGDANFRLPDISGLMAQVEVRSPFLDYRMVEFAAQVPHHYKVSRLLNSSGNKYLPKRLYEKFVPKDLAWSRKKGMGWNLRWDRSIAYDEKFTTAFRAAYDAVDKASLDSRLYRAAWEAYVADIRNGKRYSAYAKAMMGGFMLGAWLLRHANKADYT